MEFYPVTPRPIDAYLAFSATEHGQTLAAAIRWSHYKHPDTTNKEWCELLGPDANNLAHMELMAETARSFLADMDATTPGVLSEDDKYSLELGAYTHDCAESITTDINYFLKTDELTQLEKEIFIANIDNFYPDCPPETRAKLEFIVQEVIFNPETRLGKIFNIIERIGYMNTGLLAADIVNSGQAPEHESLLKPMVVDVLNVNVKTLVELTPELPAVELYLQRNQAAINAAFESIPDDVFHNYPLEQMQAKINEFRLARLAWSSRAPGLARQQF